jgi:molybdate-binding protein
MAVEDLFGGSASQAVSVWGEDFLAGGSPLVAVATVGETLVAVPAHCGVANSERWAWADARVITGGAVEMLDDGATSGLVIAGCDPALGLLADLTQRTSGHRMLTVHASTGRSLNALAAGRVHGVVVHAPAGQMPDAPVPVKRWHLAKWQVGVASGRATGVPSVTEIAERDLKVVQRDPGASTQSAFARALRRIGAEGTVRGPVGDGHVDVARRVSLGAPAGLTMEAAARSFGLGFDPLEDHEVQVWIDARWAGLAAVTAMMELVGGNSLRSRLALIGGYDLSTAATEVA